MSDTFPEASHERHERHAPSAQHAVIYCRVSSVRQANEGDGLAGQERTCRNYADARGYVVASVFRDGITGGTDKRPGFVELLAFLDAWSAGRGVELVVIVDDLKRFAREVEVHFDLKYEIVRRGARMESPHFRFEDTPEGKFVETVIAAQAELERNQNKRQVLSRMRARLEQGYWTFPPPPGYRYERHPAHKKWLVPTEETRRVLGTALALYGSARFLTQRELALHLRDQGYFGNGDSRTGITVLEKRVGRILSTSMLPLYAGLLEYTPWGIGRREARHEAVITPATLLKIEARLSTPGRPWGAPRADADSLLILRNFVRCRACGRPLTGSLAKGKYPRYNCYFQECPLYGHSYSAREKVTPAFVSLLRSLAPSPEFMDLLEMQVGRLGDRTDEERKAARAVLERDLKEARGDIQTLARRVARAGSDAIASALEAEIAALSARAAETEVRLAEEGETPNYREALRAVNTWFRDPAGMWESGSDNQKRTVHRIVFTVPPVFDPIQGFNTYELSLPYRVSAAFSRSNQRVVDLAGRTSHLRQAWLNILESFRQWTTCVQATGNARLDKYTWDKEQPLRIGGNES